MWSSTINRMASKTRVSRPTMTMFRVMTSEACIGHHPSLSGLCRAAIRASVS